MGARWQRRFEAMEVTDAVRRADFNMAVSTRRLLGGFCGRMGLGRKGLGQSSKRTSRVEWQAGHAVEERESARCERE